MGLCLPPCRRHTPFGLFVRTFGRTVSLRVAEDSRFSTLPLTSPLRCQSSPTFRPPNPFSHPANHLLWSIVTMSGWNDPYRQYQPPQQPPYYPQQPPQQQQQQQQQNPHGGVQLPPISTLAGVESILGMYPLASVTPTAHSKWKTPVTNAS